MQPIWVFFLLFLPCVAVAFGKRWAKAVVFLVPLSWALSGVSTWVLFHWNFVALPGPTQTFHATYFVIAHNNYLFFAALVLTVMPALWLFLDWLKANFYPRGFAVLALGSHLGIVMAQLPQHVIGLVGMPRRYIDYPEMFGFWNRLSSLGAFVSVAALALFIALVLFCIFRRSTRGPMAT